MTEAGDRVRARFGFLGGGAGGGSVRVVAFRR
jgi:hypothetical protein